MADDGFARSRPITEDQWVWGYGGQPSATRRRVSVSPNMMLINTLRVGAEARGVLLTIFCRYWLRDEGPEAELVRKEHSLTIDGFDLIIRELIDFKLVKHRKGRLIPMQAFGPNPDSPQQRSENRRKAPPDWQELRETVFERDGYSCVYCGSGSNLHCDHVEPVALGGGHEITNLVTACGPCNLSKGPKTLAEWRPHIAAALRRAAEASE